MDYKEKYEQALERARQVHTTNVDENKKSTEYIFPELKESEDEKIRKKMIKIFKSYQNPLYNINTDKREGLEISKILTWLEKQGEQKSEEVDNLHNYLYGEQKPTDKVEPKFKVGDWIVTPDNEVKQIEKVTFGNYWFTDETLYDIIDVDNKGHLWTIKDAKDGDVLYECNEKNPFIFKELNTKHIGNIASYCDIFNGIFNPNEDNWTTLDIVPATKEQCDLLFQKMKEAGYEWDAEKKELKKIEQKPKFYDSMADLIADALIEEIENSDLDDRGKHNRISWIKSHRQKPTNKIKPRFKLGDTIRPKGSMAEYTIESISGECYHGKGWGLSIGCDEDYELVEQKPSWSEEDESILQNILVCLKNGWRKVPTDILKYESWLKSFKERVGN